MPAVTATTQAELRNILRHERGVELAFEGVRFWDLRRWNLLKDAMRYAGKPYQEPRRIYLPIPQNQIDLTQGVLKQNDGW